MTTDERKARAQALATRIVMEGKRTEVGWNDEGNAESGPIGGSNRMYRMGKAWVMEGSTGGWWLWMPIKDQDGFRFMAPVHQIDFQMIVNVALNRLGVEVQA